MEIVARGARIWGGKGEIIVVPLQLVFVLSGSGHWASLWDSMPAASMAHLEVANPCWSGAKSTKRRSWEAKSACGTSEPRQECGNGVSWIAAADNKWFLIPASTHARWVIPVMRRLWSGINVSAKSSRNWKSKAEWQYLPKWVRPTEWNFPSSGTVRTSTPSWLYDRWEKIKEKK